MATTTEPVTLPQLSTEEMARYSRHLILPEVGMEGQQKLKAAKVLCIGTGGLGSPLAFYLAAAGIGTLGLVDFDVVDSSNLQRQIIHSTKDVGRSKIVSATEKLVALNPFLNVVQHETMLTSQNAIEIISQYDIVADGTDNFPTRYLVNDACVLTGKPNAYGSIFRFEGQASVFATEHGPCYRCLYPEPPPPGLVPSCAEGGVLGILPGLVGVIQATEVIKLILGKGEPLIGRLLLVNSLDMKFRELKLRKNPECPVCGKNPTVTKLIDYQQFCGIQRRTSWCSASRAAAASARQSSWRRTASASCTTWRAASWPGPTRSTPTCRGTRLPGQPESESEAAGQGRVSIPLSVSSLVKIVALDCAAAPAYTPFARQCRSKCSPPLCCSAWPAHVVGGLYGFIRSSSGLYSCLYGSLLVLSPVRPCAVDRGRHRRSCLRAHHPV